MPTPHRRPSSATLALARELIACRSVTPADGGSLALLESRLAAAGFRCERLDRGPVSNLWARHGSSGPLVCLAGHVDVVPPGPLEQWTSDPFTPTERDGLLYGRGAADMKASVAAMVTAAERVVPGGRPRGSVALLLTSDEEGDAVDGTAAVVEALRQRGETHRRVHRRRADVDRSGSATRSRTAGADRSTGSCASTAMQCHIAYPERGRNPIHDGAPALAALVSAEWDRGNAYFQPTSFQISNVQAGAGASNIIPGALDGLIQFPVLAGIVGAGAPGARAPDARPPSSSSSI